MHVDTSVETEVMSHAPLFNAQLLKKIIQQYLQRHTQTHIIHCN